MKNKETGEFELVVGDKQLLSGFFVGVVLLAVVFVLGYVLGRSSPKSASVAADTTAAAPVTPVERPQASTPQTPASSEPPASTPAPAATDTAQTAPAQPVEPPPQPTTKPARDATAPAAPAPAPASAATPPPDPSKASYWQVSAGSKSSADAFLQTLKDKGFPVIIHPGPNNLTAVWVGPYYDKESLAKAKKQLEEAGFPTYKRP